MLTFLGRRQEFCDGVSRRDFLRVGALTVGGLTLADVLRLQARAGDGNGTLSAGPSASGKAVIMVYLPGGPTHLDSYDMKPGAAAEFRGELRQINSNVPGIGICELMPQQAKIMDKLSILRGVSFLEEHSAHYLWTGASERVKRPAFGSIVSYLRKRSENLPPYVSLMDRPMDEDPAYVGSSHRPFVPTGPGLENLQLVSNVNLDRLGNRKELLHSLDTIRREVDYGGALAGIDGFTGRALDMITSSKAREAFDVNREPEAVRERYGPSCMEFLKARRLVEAGVSVVTLALGGWDAHSGVFTNARQYLPPLDRGIHALVTDLHERGMAKDVAVIVWGEFGRTPRVNPTAGRDHWPLAGFAVMAGGQFKHGQVIGETDAHGERAKGQPISVGNVLATLYRHMGIDPAMTIADHNGRPTYLVDDRELVKELV